VSKVIRSMTNEDISQACNQAIELVLERYKKDGIAFEKNYRVVLCKKGFFGDIINKLFRKEESDYFAVVDLLPLLVDEKEVMDE